MKTSKNVRSLSAAIQAGDLSAEASVMEKLELAQKSDSIFVSINEKIMDQAREVDRAVESGKSLPPLSGIPITLKDLFDVEGETTLAGSVVLKHFAKPAVKDCQVVMSLRNAGLLFLGRTNMSEFAFSGMGMNPHYGIPKSIWDRDTGRLPGGSSSGSAVSVAENIVSVTMGSDTAGSCRVPAAFNGIVGVKPSFGRLSLEGIYPLSPTSDAPGPLGIDVDSCYIIDQLISGVWDGRGPIPELSVVDPAGIKLVIPESIVMDELDEEVLKDFQRSVKMLQDKGFIIENVEMGVIDQCVDMFSTRAVAGYEALQHHRELLEQYGDEYDPFVYNRIIKFNAVTDEEQHSRYQHKGKLRQEFEYQMKVLNADAVIFPTTPCIPPAISEAQIPEKTAGINLRNLRNTCSANYFDGCSMSLPMHQPGNAPTGLMISSINGADIHLYEIGFAIEAKLE